jgi:hypothetical protein
MKLANRIREIADRLSAETELQKKYTARILGAAAQIAQNQDSLITEVARLAESDLKDK